MLNRRNVTIAGLSLLGAGFVGQSVSYAKKEKPKMDSNINWKNIKKSEWKTRLTDQEYYVMRKGGTERSGNSPLNHEKRAGIFACAACGLPLFKAKTKYESGTGWPSFWQPIAGAVETKTDFKLVYPRKEYHCSRCGAHQGHVFKDGPKPSGLRYCNNGIALDFTPIS
ncbi:MAG: peptide-methionine (R)-S-oxide reductase MsrB [Robiginitomaculum sp.]